MRYFCTAKAQQGLYELSPWIGVILFIRVEDFRTECGHGMT